MFLYADDAKVFKHVTSDIDRVTLQHDLDKLSQWSDQWLLKLNATKCKVVSFGRHLGTKAHYCLSGNVLEQLLIMKDLGVVFDERLKFGDHIEEKINKAYSVLGIIKRNFKYLSEECLVLLYKSMVRSHPEYAQNVWSLHHQGHIKSIEKVQMRATKLVPTRRQSFLCHSKPQRHSSYDVTSIQRIHSRP